MLGNKQDRPGYLMYAQVVIKRRQTVNKRVRNRALGCHKDSEECKQIYVTVILGGGCFRQGSKKQFSQALFIIANKSEKLSIRATPLLRRRIHLARCQHVPVHYRPQETFSERTPLIQCVFCRVFSWRAKVSSIWGQKIIQQGRTPVLLYSEKECVDDSFKCLMSNPS